MTRTIVAILLFVVAALARAGGPSALAEHEAPRATDLLRAQRLAERTQSRLRLPRSSRRGWARGGEGWNAPPRSAEQERSVVINVGPGRRAPAPKPTE